MIMTLIKVIYFLLNSTYLLVISMDTSFKVPWANLFLFLCILGMEVPHVGEQFSAFPFFLLNSGGRHPHAHESVVAPRSCDYILFFDPRYIRILVMFR